MRSQTLPLALLGALAISAGLAAPAASAQTWQTVTSSRQVWDQRSLDVEIQYGAGELRIAPAGDRVLYQAEIRYDAEAFEPEIDYDEEDGQLELGVSSRRGDRRHMDFREGARATIALTREVPLDLELEFGAGKAEIELGDMSLRTLSISTGASETRISFSSPNRIPADDVSIRAGAADLRVLGLGNTGASHVDFEGGVGATVLDFSGAATNMTASVDMGVGAVTLRLPRTHGIQLNRSSFLSSFDAAGLNRQGNSYYSTNWNRADRKLVIDVSAALGAIEIEWVD